MEKKKVIVAKSREGLDEKLNRILEHFEYSLKDIQISKCGKIAQLVYRDDETEVIRIGDIELDARFIPKSILCDVA